MESSLKTPTGKLAVKEAKRQRGSVLVGVIGFSVILSVGAAAYVLNSGRAYEAEMEAMDKAKLYASAEGALTMAADYTTNEWYASTMMNGIGWEAGREHAIIGWRNLDGARVTAYHFKPHADTLQLVSLATLGDHSDTLKLVMTFEASAAPQYSDKFSKIDRIISWKDSLIEHR